ncbi:6109_t:CDS:1 [Racocetra fulgida]|uniref:6109_t:CDS:1 n=1 Tax=Racocetra fulgida TaxID=60492 RepID=A0A9N9DB53_9GLOM|nr:6109_t:CDS:1 [Racocetra fulgida]
MNEKIKTVTNGIEEGLLNDNVGVKIGSATDVKETLLRNDNIGKKTGSWNGDLGDKIEIVTNVSEEALLRKIDIKIIPLFTLLYTICFLDRYLRLTYLLHNLNYY